MTDTRNANLAASGFKVRHTDTQDFANRLGDSIILHERVETLRAACPRSHLKLASVIGQCGWSRDYARAPKAVKFFFLSSQFCGMGRWYCQCEWLDILILDGGEYIVDLPTHAAGDVGRDVRFLTLARLASRSGRIKYTSGHRTAALGVPAVRPLLVYRARVGRFLISLMLSHWR